MKTTDTSRLVAVFSGKRMEAEVMKGLLEANGIPSMLQDETLSNVTSPYLLAGGEVKLLVHPDNEKEARTLMA